MDCSQCQCQSWIYIAHKREASNALARCCRHVRRRHYSIHTVVRTRDLDLDLRLLTLTACHFISRM